MHIGERLKEERLRLGLNQTQLAELGDVILRSQQYYEKGERMPDAAYLAKIAEGGVDIAYVITGTRSHGQELKSDEAALLDNYRHSPEEGKRAIEATSAALAKREPMGKGKEALIKKV